MAAKFFCYGYATGFTLDLFVQRQSDGLFLQSDGTFAASSDSPPTFVETFFGFYQYIQTDGVWVDGLYNVLVALRTDLHDGLFAFVQRISGDAQIGFVEASSITSKNAVAALSILDQQTQASIASLASNLGVLSDRIDTLNSVLSRRDYRTGTTE